MYTIYCTERLDNVYDGKTWEEVLNDFKPRINYFLLTVPIQERDDLEQEITMKVVEKINMLLKNTNTEGFWEIVERERQKHNKDYEMTLH